MFVGGRDYENKAKLKGKIDKIIEGMGEDEISGMHGIQEIIAINNRVESEIGVFMKKTRERYDKEEQFLQKLK